MARLCETKYCTGCGACYEICNHNAIQWRTDKKGFLYPYIDNEKCINCHLCEKKCPILNTPPMTEPHTVIACHNKNEEERLISSSGGIATLLGRQALSNKNETIYGCIHNESSHSFCHTKITNLHDLKKARGSKYIQSNIISIYKEIKNDISSKKKVLFIGTPCQVAGIKSIFKNSEQLVTIDLICHGVPSPQYFYESLPQYITKDKISNIIFRVNSQYHLIIKGEDNKTLFERPLDNDIYMKAFFNKIIFRPSCYSCPFAQKKRVSDLTLGDFWGLKSNYITQKENGVSLVLINTQKGSELLKRIEKDIKYEVRSLKEAQKYNEQLNTPSKANIRAYIFNAIYPYFNFKKSVWITLFDKMIAMKIKYFIKKI